MLYPFTYKQVEVDMVVALLAVHEESVGCIALRRGNLCLHGSYPSRCVGAPARALPPCGSMSMLAKPLLKKSTPRGSPEAVDERQ